ncbi:hypothetical protein FIBSPDRAFT_434880 [Athelia psychrophila]|uniref:Uncharacterized protein n=1 Tax=Athelia psychrophila TaxID=1759441 RepID=A0A166VM47_9AGAM|nr:hypothetical protein FIBSPDRAFT_434880 [Fibularhizoctonia sp. CBS 109695]
MTAFSSHRLSQSNDSTFSRLSFLETFSMFIRYCTRRARACPRQPYKQLDTAIDSDGRILATVPATKVPERDEVVLPISASTPSCRRSRT